MKIFLTSAFGAILLASSVTAQDVCRDIIPPDGPVRTSTVDTNYYSRQVVAARYSKMTIENVKNHLKGNGGFSCCGFSIDGDASDEEIRTFQEDVSSSLDVDNILKNEGHLLSISGDPVITSAWQACMASRGGMFASFDPIEGDTKQAFLKVEYFHRGGMPYSPRVENIQFGNDVDFGRGRPALRRGSYIAAGTGLSAIVERPDANVAFVAAVSIDGFGTTQAYLPASGECSPRIIEASNGLFYSNPDKTEDGLVVGEIPSHQGDRPTLTVNEDCSLDLRFSVVPVSNETYFPDIGTAPWFFFELIGPGGAPIGEAFKPKALASTSRCAEPADHSYRNVATLAPDITNQINSFRPVLSAARNPPGGCPAD